MNVVLTYGRQFTVNEVFCALFVSRFAISDLLFKRAGCFSGQCLFWSPSIKHEERGKQSAVFLTRVVRAYPSMVVPLLRPSEKASAVQLEQRGFSTQYFLRGQEIISYWCGVKTTCTSSSSRSQRSSNVLKTSANIWRLNKAAQTRTVASRLLRTLSSRPLPMKTSFPISPVPSESSADSVGERSYISLTPCKT